MRESKVSEMADAEQEDRVDQPSEKSPVTILKERCKGCGFCTVICPVEILQFKGELNSKGYPTPTVIDPSRCTQCTLCMLICPDFAIVVEKKRKGAAKAKAKTSAQ